MTIHDKINLRGLAQEFPRISEKEFKERFRRLKIGSTGAFESNFKVTGKASLNPLRVEVEIIYRYYAYFTHLGVGKGVKQTDTGIQKLIGSGRKRKPWMKGLSHTRYRLAELFGVKIADAMESEIANSMDVRLNLKF
jgi:hypothetical protein